MSTVVVKDGEGSFIPATQRPDGSWRKARRVKDGYVPQEEVPLYESKGKQWANRKPLSAPDLAAERQREMEIAKKNKLPYSPIPGLIIDPNSEVKKKKKKKKKAVNPETPTNNDGQASAAENVTNKAKAKKLSQSSERQKGEELPLTTQAADAQNSVAIDPIKRIKNLKKKLREIETLEQRIDKGEIKSLDKDQLDKVSRKPDVLSEILALELTLQN